MGSGVIFRGHSRVAQSPTGVSSKNDSRPRLDWREPARCQTMKKLRIQDLTPGTSLPTRRAFLKTTVAAGGGLVIAGYLPMRGLDAQQRAAFEPNVWVKI